MLSPAVLGAAVRATLLALLLVMGWNGSARASITPLAEPAYTKTATTDVFAWNWRAVDGLNLDTNQKTYRWWICLKTYREGVVVEDSNGTLGWGSPNCWLARDTANGASSGTTYSWPFTTTTVLDDGKQYRMCLTGYNIYGFYNSYPSTALLWDNVAPGCNSSTIDRNQPSVNASIDGATEVTKDPLFALRIDYSDPTSPPWFGSDGRASNWTCLSRGADCLPQSIDPACSVPANKYARITSFSCQTDMTSQPDGDWRFCVRSADAAVPDNPTGPDQFAGATSDKANLSGVACGYVTLDRQPPVVVAKASAAEATVGQLIDFTASGVDPSGLASGFSWDFGDNTPQGAGATASHTYTQAGTFRVTATSRDRAGNAGAGDVTITVRPAQPGTPPAPTTPGASNPGTNAPGTNAPGTSNPGASTPGTTNPGANTPNAETSTGVMVTTSPVTRAKVSSEAGGGGAVRRTVGGLVVVAPKRFSAGKRTTMFLGLTAPGPGNVEVELRKGKAHIVDRGAVLAAAGSYSMKLKVPRSLKAATYVLRVSYTPAGKPATTKSLNVRVVRARGTRSAVAVPRSARLRGTAVDRVAHGRVMN